MSLEHLEERTLLTVLNSTSWTSIGPLGVNTGISNQSAVYGSGGISTGRVTGLATDPINANIIYAGSSGGGVWKTTDGGQDWFPTTDSQANQVIGSVAVAPSQPQTVYAGTGDANNVYDAYSGDGVLKSTDGGQTWTLLGQALFQGTTIGTIVVDPRNANNVYAAVSNNGADNDSQNHYTTVKAGVYHSTDGGQTWTLALDESSAFADVDVSGLVMNPINPQILYAAVGTVSGLNTTNGVYKSADGGATWAPAGNFLTAAGGVAKTGRISLAISPTDPNELLSAVALPSISAGSGPVLLSTDGGLTWTAISGLTSSTTPSDPVNLGGNYANVVAIDPNNANTLYVGGSAVSASGYNLSGQPLTPPASGIVESTDGGKTWTDLSTDPLGNAPHDSQHAMAFDANGNLLVGNDGGVWGLRQFGTGPRASFSWTDLNGSGAGALGITIFNSVALNPQDSSTVYGGAGGLGTIKTTGGNPVWTVIQPSPETAGPLDGGAVIVVPTNPSTVITDTTFFPPVYIQNISPPWVTISTNAGKSFTPITNGITGGFKSGNAYIPALAIDPNDPNHLLYGGEPLDSTANQGKIWTSLNTPEFAVSNSLAISPANSQVIYQATVTNNLYVSKDGGNSWTKIDITATPSNPNATQPITNLSQIIADPNAAGTAYVVSSAYNDGGIWKTTNYGASWTNIAGSAASGLPTVPIYSVAVDDSQGRIFVGTKQGVYATSNGGNTWAPFGSGLPSVPVTSLAIDTTSLDILLAGTHGRGAYEIFTSPKVSIQPSTLQGNEGVPITAPGQPTNNGLPLTATFSDPNGPATAAGASTFAATINWGDGQTSSGSQVTIAPLNDGSGNYGLFASHAYASQSATPYTIGISITSSTNPTPSTAVTTVTIGDATLTALATTPPIQATAGLPLTPSPSVVGSFSDANPNGKASEFTASINWGDGTAPTIGTITQPGGPGTPFLVSGGHIYAAISPKEPITATVTEPGGTTLTLSNFAVVSDAALTPYPNVAAPQMIISTYAGSAASQVIGEFTSANINAVASQFQAVVNWGDGSAPVTLPASDIVKKGTVFVVSAVPPFAHAGSDTITTTITDIGSDGLLQNGATTTLTTLDNVTSLPVTSSTTISTLPINGVIGQSSSFKVATITSSNTQALASDYQAPTITWGDGTSSTGTLQSLGAGKFAINGSHAYTTVGQFNVSVSIQGASGGTPITGSSTATIADAPITVAPIALSGTSGQAITSPGQPTNNGQPLIATFTDGNLTAPLGQFTATIDWGDGTTPTFGTITQPGGVGTTFDVFATQAHVYATAGVYPLSVTVSDTGGATDTKATTATVVAGGFSVSPVTIAPIDQGGALTGTVALLNSGNPLSVASEYVATINWGDGSFSMGTLVNQGNGVYTVSGPVGHVYAGTGTYQITTSVVSISTGKTSSASTSVTVNDAPILAGPSSEPPLQGVAGVAAASGPLVSFTQFAGTPASDFTATINWGDGTVTAGTVAAGAGGSFVVSGSNLYLAPGTYHPSVVVNDSAGGQATLATTAVVSDAPISSSSNAITALVGRPFRGAVATFTDQNKSLPAQVFQAQINWGDGTAPTLGTIAGANGSFTVSGAHTYGKASASLPVSVSIVNLNGTSTASSSANARVVAPLTGSLFAASDTGYSNHDGVTRVTNPIFAGTADPGSTVVLYAAGAGNLSAAIKVGTAQADATGHWNATISPLPGGVYAVTASMLDSTTGAVDQTLQLATGNSYKALYIATSGATVASTSLTPSNGTLHVVFQMGPASMVLSQLINASNYQLSQINARTGALTPLTPTGVSASLLPYNQVLVNVTYNRGARLANAGYVVTLLANNLVDQAGNPLIETHLVTFPQATNSPNPNYVAEIDVAGGVAGAPHQYISLAEQRAASNYVRGGTRGTIIVRVPAAQALRPRVTRL